MSKQFGDVVTMVRNGVEVNALVAMSSPQADGEHLSVIYLDPKASSSQLTGMQLDAAVKKEFGVTAHAEGKPVGFKEYESLNEANLKFLEATDTDITATQSKQIDELNEKLATVTKALADQEAIAVTQTEQIKKLSGELGGDSPAPPAEHQS